MEFRPVQSSIVTTSEQTHKSPSVNFIHWVCIDFRWYMANIDLKSRMRRSLRMCNAIKISIKIKIKCKINVFSEGIKRGRFSLYIPKQNFKYPRW
eukprot:UN08739